ITATARSSTSAVETGVTAAASAAPKEAPAAPKKRRKGKPQFWAPPSFFRSGHEFAEVALDPLSQVWPVELGVAPEAVELLAAAIQAEDVRPHAPELSGCGAFPQVLDPHSCE